MILAALIAYGFALSTAQSIQQKYGAFGTAIAIVLLAAAAGKFGAARASGTTFLMSVVALALGVLILHEQIALLSVASGLVCLLGAWLMKHAAAH